MKGMVYMASTASEKRYSREYYKTHPRYRRKKIQDRKDYYHDNQKEQNAYAREYYHKKTSYRKYKIAYAKAYQKRRVKK